MYSTQALTIGETARASLQREGELGRVHSAFKHTINLHLNDGNLMTVACKSVENSPINLRVDREYFHERYLKDEANVKLSQGCLKIGQHLKVTGVNEAQIWKPDVNIPENIEAQTLRKSINTLAEALRLYGQPEGFKPLLRPIQQLSAGLNVHEADNWNPYAVRAFPPIKKLFYNLASRQVIEAADEAKKLVGLGPGLTPSGDDFLCGLLNSLSVFNPVINQEQEIKDFIEGVMSTIDGRTNEISKAYLKHYASGQPSETVSELYNHLVDFNPIGVERLVHQICQRGHSSGTDMLIGVMAGFQLLLREKVSE